MKNGLVMGMSFAHPRYSPSYFRAQGWCFHNKKKLNQLFPMRTYQAYFGVDPLITFFLWNKIRLQLMKSAIPFYLLCTLMFLKTYPTESVLSGITGTSEKTLRQWIKYFLHELASLKQVSPDYSHNP